MSVVGESLSPITGAAPPRRPLVSIVIPAYNHARYLADAIESILAQDYPGIELIVIDDGSTDETPALLQRYEGRATIIRQENCGQAATLNRGWELARGDYLGYLGADDALEPAAVSSIVEALGSEPSAVLAYPDFRLVDPHFSVIRNVRAPDFSYRDMLVSFVCPPGPGALFRRSAFAAAGGWNPEYRQMPDYEYWLRLGLLGDFIHVRRLLASFRVHPGSQTYGAVSEERAEEPVRILTAFFQDPRIPGNLAALRERAVSRAFLMSAQLHLRAGRAAKALACMRRAAALYPSNLFSLRSGRALANAVFNRLGHRLLWTARHAFRRPSRGEPGDRGHS